MTNTYNGFAWSLDLTPNMMFSLYEYPIPGKDGLPLCEQHGPQLDESTFNHRLQLGRTLVAEGHASTMKIWAMAANASDR